MGELVGELSLYALVPELDKDGARLKQALNEVATAADNQILRDGMGAELAFTYHLYVVDLLLTATAILDAVGVPPPREVLSALDRSGSAIWAQIGAAEHSPTYGDTDDAIAVRLSSQELRGARVVATSIACRLPHPRARLAGTWPDWTSWWLFGPEGRDRFETTVPAPKPSGEYLGDGGLVLFRRDDLRVSFDVGPLGFLSLAAHGHADALTVTLADRGGELITDPGVGSYWRDSVAREAFRSTGFHATVEVDGVSQSDAGGPFLWTRHATARAHGLEPEEGWAFGEHDGYLALEDPVRHLRAVAVLPHGDVLVADLLLTAGSHSYRQQWPLGRELEANYEWLADDQCSGAISATVGDRRRLHVCVASTEPGEWALVKGVRDPFGGWWSERLESMEPAWLGSWRLRGSGPVAIAAVLSRRLTDDSCIMAITREGEMLVVTYAVGGVRQTHRIDFLTSRITTS